MSDRPAGLEGLARVVFEQALQRVGALREEIRRLEQGYADREDLPGTLVLLRALGLLVGESEREIVREGRDLAERGPTDRRETGFRRSVGGRITTLEKLMPEHIARAGRTHDRDIEALVGPFTRLANTLSPGRELIFDPVDRYEIVFSSVQRSLRGYAQHFSDELRQAIEALPHVTVISYPAVSRNNILQHSLLGHEVAHLALAEPLRAGEPPVGSLVFNEAFAENFSALREELPGATAQERRKQEVERHSRLQNWFLELACDIAGARLVGPALLLGLVDFAVVRNRWAQRPDLPGYDTHPGLAWRLRNLLPEARRFLKPPRTTEPWEKARVVIDRIEQAIPDEDDTISAIERRIIERALELFTQRLDVHLGKKQLLVGELERLFDPAWDKLKHSIPPAEEIFARSRPDRRDSRLVARRPTAAARLRSLTARIRGRPTQELSVPEPWSTPIDWRVILNATAFYQAAESMSDAGATIRHLPVDPRFLHDRLEFNSFVRGTIELAEIQFRLQEVKEELDQMTFPSAR